LSWQNRLADLDDRLSDRLRVAEQHGMLRNLAILLVHSGDSWFWLLGLGLVWCLGPDFWQERAQVLFVGILVTAVLVMVVKFTVRRRRPEGEWGKIYRSTDPHSFPSGHAARAVMLGVMAVGLGPAWFAVLLCGWAPLVVLARVAMGLHYPTDVMAGALFGLVMGGIMLSLLPAFPF